MRKTAGVLGIGLLLLLPAAVSARTAGEVHVVSHGASFTTKAKLNNDAPLPVTISGTFTSTLKTPTPGVKACKYDAFYVYDCFAKPGFPSELFVGVEADNFQPTQIRRLSDPVGGMPPPYSPTHRYSFQLHCEGHSDGCGRVRFYAGLGTSSDRTWSGTLNVEVGGEDTPASVRVDFSIIVTGKPNVAIKGADARLVGSRLVGSGHATFTKRQGSLLVATESKGSIVHEDVLTGGRRVRLELGIITGRHGKALGTTYSPDTGRLNLLLKVKGSNDPGCPESGLLTPTLASLTLIPAGGARDQAVLFGYPGTAGTEACKAHAHAWANGSGGVTVRLRVTLH